MRPPHISGPLVAILLSLVPLAPGVAAADTSALLRRLLAIAGLTAAPGQMRSEEVEPGSIWLATVHTGALRQLTPSGGYLSPVFAPDGRSILALKGGVVVAIPLSDGPPRPIRAVNGALKIVGFDSLDPQLLLLLLNRVDAPLVSLSLADGSVQVLPVDRSSSDLQRLLGTIRNQDRVYGTIRVYLRIERKEGLLRPVEWTDIHIASGSAPARNISQCDGVNCTQPALSPDGRSVAFIRSIE